MLPWLEGHDQGQAAARNVTAPMFRMKGLSVLYIVHFHYLILEFCAENG